MMNYYEILGVNAAATDQQIKEAYRREAMKWHPDRHEGVAAKAHADKKFKELALAYRTLRDPAAREAYDREVEQKLREEYNARQRERAKQQKEWAQQEQGRYDFADTEPPSQEEAMSGDDANQMFFEQMLDLAFELAGRAFPESKIIQALVALGCPELMAKAVAAVAIKKFSNSRNKREEPVIPTIAAPISEAEWKNAEPYYLAFITKKTKDNPLTENYYETIDKKYKNRGKIALTFIAAAIVASFFINTKFSEKIVFLLIAASIIFLSLNLINIFTIPDEYFKESRKRRILSTFRDLHLGRSVNTFNFYAFFFNIGWLSYRKMYLFAFLGALTYITTALVTHFYLNLSLQIIFGTQILISALLGIFSYQIYYRFAETRINQHLKNHSNGTHQILTKKYGYSIASAITAFILTGIIYTPVNAIISTDIQEKIRQEQLTAEEKERAIQAAAMEKQRATEEEKKSIKTRGLTNLKTEYNSTLAYIEARHPELNPDSPRHNSNAVSWVIERKIAYEGQGLTSLNALKKAVQEYELEIQKSTHQNITADSNTITEQSNSGNYIGTGESISLNFGSIEIRSLLQVISDFTNLKIRPDDEVSGSVSIHIKDTPWDEVLSKVIHAKGLKIVKIGPTTLYVHPNYMSDDLAYSRAIKNNFNR